MKRLLFVSHYPFYGGPQNTALRLAAPLEEHGWHTTVVLPDEPGNARRRLEDAGVDTIAIRLGRLRATDLRANLRLGRTYGADVRRIRRLIAQQQADLVVVAGLANAQAGIATNRSDVALIWQILDTRTPRPLSAATLPYVVRAADVVMTTGKALADAHPQLRRLGDRVIPFYPPVDVELFRPDETDGRAAREELGLSKCRHVVGLIANITPQKNLEGFIELAETVGARRPDVGFAIVGDLMETQGAYLERIRTAVATSPLAADGRLVLRESGGSVAHWLRAFDLFALTSEGRSEGIPTAVLEALASGVPVVARDVGGLREAIRDGVTGRVVADAVEQATAIEGLLDDADVRERMAHAARDDTVERFGIPASVDVHLRSFERALARRGGRARGPS